MEREIKEMNSEKVKLKEALEGKQKELAECQEKLRAREDELLKADVKLEAEKQIFDLKVQLAATASRDKETEQAVSTMEMY